MFKKSVEMNNKTTIALAKVVKKFLEKKGAKSETFEDILIDVIPELKEYLVENGYLILESLSEETNKKEQVAPVNG